MIVLFHAAEAAAALFFLTIGLRLAMSPRGCAGTPRNWSPPAGAPPLCTVPDLTDVQAAPCSRTTPTKSPTNQLAAATSAATSTAGSLTHTHTGGTP